MVNKNQKQLRQLALEKIADHHGFWPEDIDVLGRLLSLKDHPKIKSLGLEHPSTSFAHYEAILKEKMESEEIKQMFTKHGLNLGGYNNGRPFYDFISGGNRRFYLTVMQPGEY